MHRKASRTKESAESAPMWQRTKHLKKAEKDLLWASANGDPHLVQDLLNEKADIKACDSLKMTALHFACRHGHGDIARILLSNGADPNVRDDKGVCPIHFAAYHGHLDCVQALCEKGADLTVQEGGKPHGATPLYRAAGHGNADVVKLLLKFGAPLATDPSFPMHAAVSEGHLSVVRLLLEAGGNLHALDDEGWSLLDCAGYEGHTETMWALLELGAKPVAHICYLRPFLKDAIESRDDDAVRLLCVRTGIGGYQKIPPSKTPAITFSVQKGFLSVTEALMEAETPSVRDAQLMAAAAHGEVKRIKAVLKLGASVQCSANHTGDTPLHLVCSSPGDRPGCVKVLIAAGADVNKPDKKGLSPLHLAASKADLSMIKALLDSGANASAKDGQGESILYKACVAGSVAAVKLLLSGGAVVKDDTSRPVHYAAASATTALLRTLLDSQSCDLSEVNNEGETPLDCACVTESTHNAQAVLSAGGVTKKNPTPPFLFKLLESAIDRDAVEEVQMLIRAGVDVHRKRMGNSGRNALQAAIEKNHMQIVKVLADAGCRFDLKLGKNNRTPFMLAVEKGNFAVVKLAVERGMPLDSDALSQWIFASAASGAKNVLFTCRDAGMDLRAPPFVKPKSGETILHVAAASGHVNLVKALLSEGLDINAQLTATGRTPLVEAVVNGHADVCSVLLNFEGGANGEAVKCEASLLADHGFAAIHFAAEQGSVELLRPLVNHSPESVNWLTGEQDETPLMLAVRKGKDHAVSFLLGKGAEIFNKNRQGKTADQLTKSRSIKAMLERAASERAAAQRQEEEEENEENEDEDVVEEEADENEEAADGGEGDDNSDEERNVSEEDDGEKSDEGGLEDEDANAAEDIVEVAVEEEPSTSGFVAPAPPKETKAQRKKRRRAEALLRITEAGFSLQKAITALDAAAGNADVALDSLIMARQQEERARLQREREAAERLEKAREADRIRQDQLSREKLQKSKEARGSLALPGLSPGLPSIGGSLLGPGAPLVDGTAASATGPATSPSRIFSSWGWDAPGSGGGNSGAVSAPSGNRGVAPVVANPPPVSTSITGSLSTPLFSSSPGATAPSAAGVPHISGSLVAPSVVPASTAAPSSSLFGGWNSPAFGNDLVGGSILGFGATGSGSSVVGNGSAAGGGNGAFAPGSARDTFIGSSLFPGSLFDDFGAPPGVSAPPSVVVPPSVSNEKRLKDWLNERNVAQAAEILILSDGVTTLEELLLWDVARMRASALPAGLRRKVWKCIKEEQERHPKKFF